MSEIITVGLDLAKNVFRPMGLMPPVARFCARSCGEIMCWTSSASCHFALWRWKPAEGLISGTARSGS